MAHGYAGDETESPTENAKWDSLAHELGRPKRGRRIQQVPQRR